ncbi:MULTISPECIES: hypothetical protein [Campylobacter]|nr:MULTISPECIES: hypothetical protein [Campylobacter]MDU6827866.1 hypothetical protein [Campylobacter sp.]UEB50739.1 hypothetical protein LK426_04625 [Campylobacter curvus]
MLGILKKAIVLLIIAAAAICAWSVLTPNHLFVG